MFSGDPIPLIQRMVKGQILTVRVHGRREVVTVQFGMDGAEEVAERISKACGWSLGRGVNYPVLIESTKVQPVYPELARKAEVTGSVILEAVVRKDGTVDGLKVLRSPGVNLGFEEAAIDAVSQWRYQPGTQNGQPVDVYFTIVVEFKSK